MADTVMKNLSDFGEIKPELDRVVEYVSQFSESLRAFILDLEIPPEKSEDVSALYHSVQDAVEIMRSTKDQLDILLQDASSLNSKGWLEGLRRAV